MHYNFDKYSHISYRSTTNVYWRKYPYKVVILNENGERRDSSRYEFYCNWQAAAEARSKTRLKRDRYLRKVVKFLPGADKYKYVDSGTTLSFYFVEAKDCDFFVDNIVTRVAEVWRPATGIHLNEMRHDPKIKVRRSYFWRRYPWCVTFRPDLAATEMYEWFRDYFDGEATTVHRSRRMWNSGSNTWDTYDFVERVPGDIGRAYFSEGSVVKMYFRDESDVILTKLGHHDHIARIERVVLANEIDGNEPDINQKAD